MLQKIILIIFINNSHFNEIQFSKIYAKFQILIKFVVFYDNDCPMSVHIINPLIDCGIFIILI
jgi:hypothetical protein